MFVEEKRFNPLARSRIRDASLRTNSVIFSVERGKARVSVRGVARTRNNVTTLAKPRAHEALYNWNPELRQFYPSSRCICVSPRRDNDRMLQVSIAKISPGFISVTSCRLSNGLFAVLNTDRVLYFLFLSTDFDVLSPLIVEISRESMTDF